MPFRFLISMLSGTEVVLLVLMCFELSFFSFVAVCTFSIHWFLLFRLQQCYASMLAGMLQLCYASQVLSTDIGL